MVYIYRYEFVVFCIFIDKLVYVLLFYVMNLVFDILDLFYIFILMFIKWVVFKMI